MSWRRGLHLAAAAYVLVAVVPLWLVCGALVMIVTGVLIEGGRHPTPWTAIAVFIVCDLGWIVATAAVVVWLRRRKLRRSEAL